MHGSCIEWLVLRGALEAGRDCTRRAWRALADAKRTFREQTLRARFCADSGRAGRDKTRIAGREDEGCEYTAVKQGWSRGVEWPRDRNPF